MRARILFLIALLYAAIASVHSTYANTITVTNTNDSGPGSLRDALAVANDGDSVDATGVSGTILLTGGELQITHNVTIKGPGAGSLAVNGNTTFVVFHNSASNATIFGFTITNGNGGGIVNRGGLTLTDSSVVSNVGGLGGGIDNDAVNRLTMLTISNSTVSENSTSLSGGGIFNEGFDGSATLTVSNSTISGNSATDNGGGIFSAALGANGGASIVTVTNSTLSGNSADTDGGAIYNAAGPHSTASLLVGNSTISGNNSSGGGGIYADGAIVTVNNSTINSNVADCNTGGGILTTDNSQVTVMNSTISGNVADDNFPECVNGAYGGGISADSGTLTVANSTVSDNLAGGGDFGEGGGLYNSGGTLAVTNSTISGNGVDVAAGGGGGVYNSAGTLAITNSTFSGNSAPSAQGGSIFNAAQATISNAVLNAGPSGGTIFNNGGKMTSLGYNLASDDGGGVLIGSGDQINTDPTLGPLQNNGGPTFTHALLPGSPAIDAGNPNFTPPPFYDQRGPGFARVVNGRIDKGALEVQGGGTPTPTPTATPTPTPRATPTARPLPTPAPRR